MFHLVFLVALVALSGVFGCDQMALNECVANSTPTNGGDDPCAAYNGLMVCVNKFSATCSNELQQYTASMGPLTTLCGGGGGGGQGGEGCDMQALSACTSQMQGMDTIMSGDTQPSEADLQRICSGYESFKTCISNLPAACGEVLKSSNMQPEQMGSMMDQYCGKDGCDMIGIQSCMKTIPNMNLNFDGDSALTSIVQVSSLCPQLQGVLTCLEPKMEGCKGNELLKNVTGVMDQMKMMVNFVCKEKKQAIMDLAACASKPAAMQKLSECESKHPMSSEPSKASKEELCKEVNTMSDCLKMATDNVCTESETSTMIDLFKDAMKMFLKGEDPCDVSGASMLMGSIWTSLILVVAAMFL